MLSRRLLLAGAAVLPLIPPSALAADEPPKPPTAAELMSPPTMSDCDISPDGKTIVVLHHGMKGKDKASYVTFSPSEDFEKARSVIVPTSAREVRWISNDRIAVVAQGDLTVRQVGNGLIYSQTPDIYFLRTNEDKVQSIAPVLDRDKLKFLSVADYMDDDPKHILLLLHDGIAIVQLHRLDLDSLKLELVEKGYGGSTRDWIVQNGKPVIRRDFTNSGKVLSLMGHVGGDSSKWSLIRKIHQTELSTPEFKVLGPSDEPGILYVAARAEGDDVRALHRLDLKTMNWNAVASRRPGRDVEGFFADKSGRFIGATYIEDRLTYDFADKSFVPHMRELNEAFQSENNIRIIDLSADRNMMLALVSGPRRPGTFVLFDRAKGAVGIIGERQPWLTPERLAQVRPAAIKSRDGSTFTAYLTVPISKGPWPLVVLPHGGPEARDSVTFDVVAQSLGARGWLVMQPNFRGSDGYGFAFAKAGHRAWNGRVMEDIEDATDQLMASGLVDKTRVAVMGMSFGGYAALMQGIRRPDLFRAVVSASGVSDLQRMLKFEAEDGEDELRYQFWRQRIGDPKTDADAIAKASPINRVADYKAPVLLMHGSADTTVPVEQSQIMSAALKKAKKPVEYIEMRGMNHNGWPLDVRQAFLLKSCDFIKAAFDKV